MIQFKRLRPGVAEPVRASEHAAGFDLTWAPETVADSRLIELHLRAEDRALRGMWLGERGYRSFTFATGLAFAIPAGMVGLVFSRSGHGFKNEVRLANCVGVIDADYRGEVQVKLTCAGPSLLVKPGDRIAQIVFVHHETDLQEVSDLPATSRGAKGFGSTGS